MGIPTSHNAGLLVQWGENRKEQIENAGAAMEIEFRPQYLKDQPSEGVWGILYRADHSDLHTISYTHMNRPAMNGHTSIPSRLYQPESVNLDDFKAICSRQIDKTTYPLACTVEQNVPIYDLAALEADPQQPITATAISNLQDEWHHILHKGPGIFVLRGMYAPSRYAQTLTSTNTAFNSIIAKERASPTSKGDHFAAGGTNDRIWNSFSKHALEDPASFIEYYSNPWLATVCSSWLGPGYRVTAQVNAVHPGGAAQESHRDYHLGFQDADSCAAYPGPTHLTSQFLTLQGAVAHSDMPVESGPTRFLPFSQTYAPGYLAWRRPEFRAFFLERFVALPMGVGDGVFFNPALFHAAGANVMEAGSGGFRRVANLLQVSSAFGKAMEMVDAVPLIERCWNGLVKRYQDAGGMFAGSDLDPEKYSREAREVRAFIQAVAEGYPFPTNLDRRPPAPSGMAPESEQDVVMRALEGGWSREKVVDTLRQMRLDSQP
jgi:ectoine hydroxylase-related dioxygenase (phytanoyl-CoA dioxygenase family)